MFIQWPYSNTETSAVNLETVILEAVSLEVVNHGKVIRLSNLQPISLDAVNIEDVNKMPRSLVAPRGGAGGYIRENTIFSVQNPGKSTNPKKIIQKSCF